MPASWQVKATLSLTSLDWDGEEMLMQVLPEVQIDQVREFVREELCERNQLERHAFEMTEKLVVKQGRPCGLFFCIHGPRSIRLTAVWDLARGAVFFYDSLGRRAASYPCPAMVN